MGRRKKKVARITQNPSGSDKKVKVDDDGQADKANDNEPSYMDKLPPEILVKTLDYLDEQQLVKCRILNSRWNEICCLLLQDKIKLNRDSKLNVQLQKCHGQKYLECKTGIKTGSFDNFIKSFSPSGKSSSRHHHHHLFPLSRFNIKNLFYMDETQMTEFISTFGPHIKSLSLFEIKKRDFKKFQKLWNLLLQSAPNIQHLGIGGDHHLDSLNLFDSNSNTNTDQNTEANSFLKNLKYIEATNDYGFGQFSDFLKPILERAPNIQEAVPCRPHRSKNSELVDLLLWKSLSKVHLVKKLEIRNVVDPIFNELLPPWVVMQGARLQHLHFYICSASDEAKDEKNTSFVYHALKSSIETLTSLKVTDLSREIMTRCFRDIKSLPNVRQLEFQINYSAQEEEIASVLSRMSSLCPNVTHLNVGFLRGVFSRVAPVLWTNFKNLKCLKISLLLFHEQNSTLVVDSAFSGYSEEAIERIQSKLQGGISLEEAKKGETQNPSVLDFKDLSRLELQFDMARFNDEMPKEEKGIRESVFLQLLPQHLKENPMTIQYSCSLNFSHLNICV